MDSGSHVGLGSVCGFPSVSASRTAVTGRQKLYVYLASKKAIAVSAKLILRSAKRRALRSRLRWRCNAAVCPISFQKSWMLPFQNWPISVCSAVGVVLSMNPRLLTSLKTSV